MELATEVEEGFLCRGGAKQDRDPSLALRYGATGSGTETAGFEEATAGRKEGIPAVAAALSGGGRLPLRVPLTTATEGLATGLATSA